LNLEIILDLAKQYGRVKSIKSYEYFKAKIVKLNLPSDEYEKAIKKLSEVLKA
jgi:hypothetical protein